MRVPHQPRRDRARRPNERARPDRQDVVDKIALPGSRPEKPKASPPDQHHPGDLDKAPQDADCNDLEWHRGRIVAMQPTKRSC